MVVTAGNLGDFCVEIEVFQRLSQYGGERALAFQALVVLNVFGERVDERQLGVGFVHGMTGLTIGRDAGGERYFASWLWWFAIA